jgi:REP element-mobilizing transposase RayT
MPHISVWIHFVWTTRDREPLLSESIRYKVFEHIRNNAREKNIFIGALNGWLEHVHCLISLGSGQNLDETMRLLKGESSHWINKNQLCRGKFRWQDEYFAVSVSESLLPKVRKYIDSQEDHHRVRPFNEEFNDFLIRGGFKRGLG